MPLLSVTVIGLLATLAGAATRRHAPSAAAARCLVGAWLGFGAGGLVGVMIDVIVRDGVSLVLLGHSGAAAFAGLAAVTPSGRARALEARN